MSDKVKKKKMKLKWWQKKVTELDNNILNKRSHMDWYRCLFHSDYRHIPCRRVNADYTCQYHKYLGIPCDEECVMLCNICKVHLCVGCWKHFHKEQCLDVLKAKVKFDNSTLTTPRY